MQGLYRQDEELDTPYKKARQEWDRRIGGVRMESRAWKQAAFLLIALVILLSASLVYLGTQSKIVPYVVEVTHEGDVQAIHVAKESNYQPNASAIRYFIGQFITTTRSLSSDSIVARNNWKNAYNFLSTRGAEMLTAAFREHDPMGEFGMKTRSVNIHTILPISADSYQADWTEIEYEKSGASHPSREYRGMFTIVVRPPKSEEELQKNPLGILINHFSWSAKP